jgi:hypothetical protein
MGTEVSTVRRAAALGLGGLLASGCGLVNGLHQATLTFRIDTMQCEPSTATATICSFFAYYGNVSSHAIQVEPSTTLVIDRTGRTFSPVAEPQTGDAFLLKPGLQHAISWSVKLPSNAKPATVTWHGSKASVQLEPSTGTPPPVPSAVPSASASASVPASVPPSASASVPATSPAPTTGVPPTTPAPTTTKATVKPTKTKTKPTVKPTTAKPTTAKPTTVPPTTPPPPVHTTTRPPVHHTTPAPTTNSTNPGGGSGGIG